MAFEGYLKVCDIIVHLQCFNKTNYMNQIILIVYQNIADCFGDLNRINLFSVFALLETSAFNLSSSMRMCHFMSH